jgi:hypothetical protein
VKMALAADNGVMRAGRGILREINIIPAEYRFLLTGAIGLPQARLERACSSHPSTSKSYGRYCIPRSHICLLVGKTVPNLRVGERRMGLFHLVIRILRN